MSMEMTVGITASVGNKTFPYNATISADAAYVQEVSVAPAKVGALTTRTDDDTGTLTMNSGHGITTGARLDLYWDGGSRRGITVGTVSVDSVPIDGGAGDVLPADETAITAMVPHEEEMLVTGDDVTALAVYSTVSGNIVLAESDDGEVVAYQVGAGTGGAQSALWVEDLNPTNPLASADVAKVFFSHGSSTETATMRVAAMRS